MTDQNPQGQFNIQKLYLKDISFESPDAPANFSFEKWEPKVDLNLNNSNRKLNDVTFEVVLTLTATVKNEDKTSFLVEVHQAGVFNIQGVSDQDLGYILNSQCMTILFPFAREVVADLVTKGGFPPLLLNPVNFDALYAQHLQNQNKSAESEEVVKH